MTKKPKHKKQKQYCNKFNEDLKKKNGPLSKPKRKRTGTEVIASKEVVHQTSPFLLEALCGVAGEGSDGCNVVCLLARYLTPSSTSLAREMAQASGSYTTVDKDSWEAFFFFPCVFHLYFCSLLFSFLQRYSFFQEQLKCLCSLRF